MKSAGKARSNGLYRHIRTSKEIIRNLLNDYKKSLPFLKNGRLYWIRAIQSNRRLERKGSKKNIMAKLIQQER